MKLQRDYDIHVGDRFYCNNYSVKNKQSLPDYMIIKEIRNGFITAKCETRTVGNRDRIFDRDNLWKVSSRNPSCYNPVWIFVDPKT